MFRAQGLENFISYDGSIFADLVRVFYCNLVRDGSKLVSKVKGKDIILIDKLIGEILDIPAEGEKFRPGHLMKFEGMNKFDVYANLCRFSKDNLYANRALSSSSKELAALPYAREVTWILEHFQVDFTNEIQTTLTRENRLDRNILGNMKIVYNRFTNSFIHADDRGKTVRNGEENESQGNSDGSDNEAEGEDVVTNRMIMDKLSTMETFITSKFQSFEDKMNQNYQSYNAQLQEINKTIAQNHDFVVSEMEGLSFQLDNLNLPHDP